LRVPAEVITVAMRWYLRYGLSFRDVEELLAEGGVQVDHVTVSWRHAAATRNDRSPDATVDAALSAAEATP
jgi:transposase-like protein